MPVPDGEQIAYQCENGHVNTKHKSMPRSADLGLMPACIECNGRLTRTLVPIRECLNCGNQWAYLGDADRPTCPECKGKATRLVDGD